MRKQQAWKEKKMWKQKCALGAVLLGILAFSAGCGVRQIRDEVTVEAGQELEFMGEDFFEASGRELEKIVFDISRVDADRPGIYPAEALVGRKRYGITVYVADRTPPMVELAGRVVFTDNLAEYDPKELIEAVYDVSDYTVGGRAGGIRGSWLGEPGGPDACAPKPGTVKKPGDGEGSGKAGNLPGGAGGGRYI